MAMHSTDQPASPSAQVVGNAFVEQYYRILHQSPELVHRFYQDTSMLSRPDPNGVITSVTTMKDINEKICSLNYKNYKAEIKTADSQHSYKDGVIVLVTGCLTGKDNLRRKFTQTFFLAPQENGFFVLNDVFRFVDEIEPDTTLGTINRVGDAQTSSLIQETEPADVLDPPTMEAVQSGGEKTPDLVEKDEQVGNGREIIVEGEPQMHENANISVAEPATPEDGLKKSYASIVSSQTKKVSSKYVPTNSPGSAARKTENQVVVTVAQAAAPEVSAPSVPIDARAPDYNDIQGEVEGHSIYVQNLPMNATVAQLEAEFKRFGPIKPGGIQVRSNKHQGYCFGFVEFQDLSSMISAIEVSPVTIGDHQVVVEKKRTTTRVGSSRGRIFPGRGGYRSDSLRARGNFNGGRGYGRNEFGGRGDGRNEFGGRGDGRNEFGGRADGRNEFGGRAGGRNEFGGRADGRNDFGGRGEGRNDFGGRGDGRNDFRGRGDFSTRGRVQGGCGGDNYQQGRGRGGRRGGSYQQYVQST